MRRTGAPFLSLTLLLLTAGGCSQDGGKKTQLSGRVLFKGNPVPAGYISFMPDAAEGGRGPVKVVQIRDGVYDTSKEADAGLPSGPMVIRIAGFDGKPLHLFPQGKQIFNPFELREVIPEGTATKDFAVPDRAAENLRVEPTADI